MVHGTNIISNHSPARRSRTVTRTSFNKILIRNLNVRICTQNKFNPKSITLMNLLFIHEQ